LRAEDLIQLFQMRLFYSTQTDQRGMKHEWNYVCYSTTNEL